MRIRTILSLAIFIAVVIWIVTCSKRSSGDVAAAVVVEECAEPTPINMMIDNAMSDFEQTKGFDRDVEYFLRRWELKGCSFALMRNDSLIYAKGYGMANDTTQCDVHHVFRIASVSKLITATAIMKLVEQGQLSLDSQVFGEEGILNDSIFLDLHTPTMKQITVEHLLRHTAGFTTAYGDPAFANFTVAQFLDKELPITVDDMVEYTTKNRLRSRPGGSYHYSNPGYIILGKIVGKVSAMDYQRYVQDSILAPAGCYNMFIGNNFEEDLAANEVNYYEVKEAEEVEACDGSGIMTMKSDGGNNVTVLGAAGGWVASATELLRFVASIDGCPVKEDILSQESVETMTHGSSRVHPIGWASIYGSQWLRSGSMAGTSALIKHQQDGYTWVFIANSSAWIGPNISKYISSHISRSVAKVKKWPARDLFEVEEIY